MFSHKPISVLSILTIILVHTALFPLGSDGTDWTTEINTARNVVVEGDLIVVNRIPPEVSPETGFVVYGRANDADDTNDLLPADTLASSTLNLASTDLYHPQV